MKKTMLVMTMVIALAMSTMAGAFATGSDIISPTSGDVVYENTLHLEAASGANEEVLVNVAVRATTGGNGCDWRGAPAPVYKADDLSTDSDGVWTKELDISSVAAGLYCFAFDYGGDRVSVDFYIVDAYAKVGGVIDLSGDGERKRGNGTHSMEGVVGNAGSSGTVGSVTINYRELGEVCTFTPGSFERATAPGIGVTGLLRGDLNFVNSCGGTATLLVLDRDASVNYPRGAIYVAASKLGYDINLDPDVNSGPGNWVPMLRGNNHVGTR